MFENPGGKLKTMYKACLYILLVIAELLLAVILLGTGNPGLMILWFILAIVVWFIWWVYGLQQLLKVDQANNIYEIRQTVERMEQKLAEKGRAVKPVQPKPEPVTPVTPPVKKDKYCPVCGGRQESENTVCIYCKTQFSQ